MGTAHTAERAHADDKLHRPPVVPRLLFVTSDRDAVGGISRYCAALAEALSTAGVVDDFRLGLDGSRRRELVESARVIARVVRTRPDLVVLGHIGFGPIGLAARATGIPFSVVAYGIEVWRDLPAVDRLTLRRAREVWSISQFTGSQVSLAATRQTVRVIGAAVPHGDPGPGKAANAELRVVTVARPADAWYKGVDTCAQAVARLRGRFPVEYRVIGPTAADADPSWLAGPSPAAATRLLGHVSEEELVDEYRGAVAVVLVSQFQGGRRPAGEGLGLAILEAAALGVPGIGSTVGGTTDCIVDGVTGYLVPPGDVSALEDRLRRLIEDPQLRHEMGRAAQRFARERFGADVFAATVARAVRTALRTEPTRRPV